MRCKNGSRSGILRFRLYPLAGALLFGFMIFFMAPAQSASATEVRNYCVECHSNPDFIVTNKKLFKYYQDWEISIHRQEEVGCDDCHGGDSERTDKKRAHGKAIGAESGRNAVNFINIPKTCGQCHDEIYEGFQKSEHFKHLVTKKQEKGEEKQGPNCITCHSSINSAALNVNTVKEVCEQCHNEKTKNKPEIPGKAETLLNKFNSIHGFYNFVRKRGDQATMASFTKKMDKQVFDLSISWHTFDLKEIGEKTGDILVLLKSSRDEIRKARKKKRSLKQ